MTDTMQQKRKAKRQMGAALFSAGAFFLAILAASFLPMPVKKAFHVDGSPHAHTASHLLAFSLLAGILRFGCKRLHAFEAALAATACGMFIEVLEAVHYRNPLEWRDIALDGAAACAGALISDWLLYRLP